MLSQMFSLRMGYHRGHKHHQELTGILKLCMLLANICIRDTKFLIDRHDKSV